MAKKYTISYKKPDEIETFVEGIKTKTLEEAKAKFQKEHPNFIVIAVNES